MAANKNNIYNTVPPFRKLRGYAFDPSASLDLDVAGRRVGPGVEIDLEAGSGHAGSLAGFAAQVKHGRNGGNGAPYSRPSGRKPVPAGCGLRCHPPPPPPRPWQHHRPTPLPDTAGTTTDRVAATDNSEHHQVTNTNTNIDPGPTRPPRPPRSSAPCRPHARAAHAAHNTGATVRNRVSRTGSPHGRFARRGPGRRPTP